MLQPPVFQDTRKNSLLITGVNAIVLKLVGECESSTAALLPISQKTAAFQFEGMALSLMMVLKRSRSAGTREGHFLNTW